MPEATSIFVGGGTPSMVPAADLVAVLDRIPAAAGRRGHRRVQPRRRHRASSSTPTAAGGVNRLSFGVQSTSAHVLAALGRTHDRANVERSRRAGARAPGSTTFNLDLIYGGAGESLDDWCRTLDDAIALDPPHVSAYALTVEAGTPLAARPAPPSRRRRPGRQVPRRHRAPRRAPGSGWYEISNWSRPGHECRHNLLYWTMGEYQGIGCASHSHRDGRRFWNLRTPDRYIDAVASRRARWRRPTSASTPTARGLEALQLSLRTRHGVPADRARRPTSCPVWSSPTRTIPDASCSRSTGRLLANEVALRLHV